MKKNLLISFLFLVVMIFIMRGQGSSLVTPQSRNGILDLEFAKSPEKYYQLRLFWDYRDLRLNIFLDFLFIASYVWFLVTACNFVKRRAGRIKWTNLVISLSITAGLFDVCENFLMLLVLNGRFNPDILQVVYYCAVLKFILAGLAVLYLLLSLPILFYRRQ